MLDSQEQPSHTSARRWIATAGKMKRNLMRLLWLLIYIFQITKSETFLEKQKRIAEEQWKREQEKQQQQEVVIDGEGEGGEAEYYYYYETDETPNNEYEHEIEEDLPPPPPKKNGYQKASATFSRQPAPLSASSFVHEYQEKLNCLTQKELLHELDRVVCLSNN